MRFRALIENSAYGVIVGWASALGFVYLAYGAGPEFMKDYGTTIVTTFGALLGALLATAAVLTQIEEQREAEERRNRAQFLAHRAKLPLALADYNKACQAGALAFYHHVVGTEGHNLADELSACALSLETISIVADVIATAHKNDAEYLVDLLSRYQVNFETVEGVSASHEDDYPNSTNSLIALGWGEAFCASAFCFEYARGRSENIILPQIKPSLLGLFPNAELLPSDHIFVQTLKAFGRY